MGRELFERSMDAPLDPGISLLSDDSNPPGGGLKSSTLRVWVRNETAANLGLSPGRPAADVEAWQQHRPRSAGTHHACKRVSSRVTPRTPKTGGQHVPQGRCAHCSRFHMISDHSSHDDIVRNLRRCGYSIYCHPYKISLPGPATRSFAMESFLDIIDDLHQQQLNLAEEQHSVLRQAVLNHLQSEPLETKPATPLHDCARLQLPSSRAGNLSPFWVSIIPL